ncbi:rRNA N6-adenosine-methyltransferase ZCCHC4 [Bombina bombina]|uniref:rRNA N6-adenosine-methyltransferase ZCCHC4 n=1 Tax=Bombina bombina TaxID=8345 RepID=UPI00235AB990|nr:rRNA N6-adenosine-methyltransferase ZCCHC4 [Bombina bombina]
MELEETRKHVVSNESFEGIQVLLSPESHATAPHCPHGPTLLFVKASQGRQQGRRFYACSACRDRKDCNFFQWEDEKVSEARLAARKDYNQRQQPPLTHKQYMIRFENFIQLPLAKRKFCRDCQQLLLQDEWDRHFAHHVLGDISVSQLKRPSLLLHPLENKKSNAQYLFADRSCTFLLDAITSLGFRRVLCVGTPRLHELIKLRASEEPKMKSLLLDIDFRYSQFYNEEEFCHYNMFNHHFFGGEEAQDICRKFLQKDDGEGVLLVTDPPFGGLVEPLAFSFKRLREMWKTSSNTESGKELPMFWIFPYFFEPRIVQCFPEFSMLDYQVDYDNHTLYKHKKAGRKQSPVRIFTDIPPEKILLPENEGYRFCSDCKRFVSSENKHCAICNSCTSKDGRRWKHCVLCKKCVKPSWTHCSGCNRCALPDHSCGVGNEPGCFLCGGKDHKHRSCPRHTETAKGNKKKKNQKRRNIQKTNKQAHATAGKGKRNRKKR